MMAGFSTADIWDDLKPKIDALIASRVRSSTISGGSTGGVSVSAHALSGSSHTGTLGNDQAPQFLLRDGSRSLTGNLSIDSGVTVDGIDISAHAANPDAHHARAHSLISTSDHTASGLAVGNVLQATGATTFTWAALDHQYVTNPLPDQHHARDHLLVGSTHTASGLTTGHVVRASGATTFAWAQLQHGDLGGVTSDQHHNQAHDILGSDHTVSGGAALDVIGQSGAGVIARLTPSSSPGAASAILRTDNSGYLTLVRLTATDRVRTPLIGTASGSLTLQPTTDLILDPDSNLTKFVDSSAVQTNSFTSGFAGAGLRIDQGISRAGKTTVETDDLYVRGRMHVYELLIHQIRATNGSVFVTSTGKAVTVTSLGGSSYRVNTDPETAHGFAVADVIRAQRFTGNGVYQCNMVVSAVASTSQFDATLASGDAPAAGMEFVRLGNTSDVSRQGTLYLTADDSGAPFIDVVDGILSHADWNTAGKVKVRLGKLTGITGTANEYGLYAQSGSETYSAGRLKASTHGLEIQNANFYLYDGSGNNQGKWEYGGITFPLLTSSHKTLSWIKPGEDETSGVVQGTALTGEMRLNVMGSLGPSRTDGYTALNMTGYDAGPVLGETSYVRAGVRRVSGTARSYTALMASQKHFLLGPAVCVSADTSNITDPTATRNGLYFTNQYGAFSSANNSEIANDTGVYQALMLIGNTDAGATRRVAIYDNLSIGGAAYNATALNVAGTAEINGGTNRPLRLVTSSAGPYAIEFYRIDQGKSVNIFNYDGDQLYADGPLMLVANTAANGSAKRMLFLSAGADATLGALTLGVWLTPSATGSSRKLHIGGGDTAMRDLILGSNAAGSYSNIGIGTDSPQRKLHVAGTIIVDGDEGGIASTIGLTDVFSSAGGAGVGTIAMNGASNQVNTQWIKIYIGTTAHYIPCWQTI